MSDGPSVTVDMTVGEIGEFALIEQLQVALPESVRTTSNVATGIGDDAAIWTPMSGRQSVISTDALVEGIHFRLDWTDWESLGFKALAVNLSDIAAMGASPILATITLGLRGTERVDDLVAMYRGIGRLAAAHGVAISGGDVVRSPERLLVSVTVVGEMTAGEPLRRIGARAGDLVAVSGTLGASAAGMKILAQPDRFRGLATTGLLVAAHLRPNPRIALGKMLVRSGASTAMDLSDGVLGDLPKILRASNVGARIDARKIPVAPALRALFPDGEWLDLATRGGEDYELLFTIAPDLFESLQASAAGIGASVTVIGEVLPAESGLSLIDLDGLESTVQPGAYDHFRT